MKLRANELNYLAHVSTGNYWRDERPSQVCLTSQFSYGPSGLYGKDRERDFLESVSTFVVQPLFILLLELLH